MGQHGLPFLILLLQASNLALKVLVLTLDLREVILIFAYFSLEFLCGLLVGIASSLSLGQVFSEHRFLSLEFGGQLCDLVRVEIQGACLFAYVRVCRPQTLLQVLDLTKGLTQLRVNFGRRSSRLVVLERRREVIKLVGIDLGSDRACRATEISVLTLLNLVVVGDLMVFIVD